MTRKEAILYLRALPVTLREDEPNVLYPRWDVELPDGEIFTVDSIELAREVAASFGFGIYL